MSFDIVNRTLNDALPSGGSLVLSYPDGRSQSDYNSGGHVVVVNEYAHTSGFSLAFNTIDIVLTWSNSNLARRTKLIIQMSLVAASQTGVTDHGALSGLSGDDHPQYHTDARGDARYYKKAEVDSVAATKSNTTHNHDATYAPIAKGVTGGDSHNHTGGAGAQIDHGGLSGLSDDDHPQYLRADGSRAATGPISGVTPTQPEHYATKEFVELVQAATVWRNPVLDKDLTAPPGGETTGDRYIVASPATGAWAGHEDDLAEYNGSSYDFATPDQGWTVNVSDESAWYVFDTTNGWTNRGSSAAATDHGALSGLADDDHAQYHNDVRGDIRYYTQAQVDAAIAAAKDHGILNGLSDDDHSQYHNDTRGDARYYTQGQVDSALSGKADAVHSHSASDISNDSGVSGSTVAAALDNIAAGAVSDSAVAASVERLRGETILSRSEYYRTLADDRNRRYVVRADDYVKRWVAFDGASGLLRSSQPAGVADGKAGTVEAFVKFTGGNGADQQILAGFYTFVFGKGTDNKIYVNGRNSAGTLIMQLKSSTTYTDADGELHILASWDLTDSNKRHLYVNGVDVLDTVATYTNDTVDHTRVTAVGNDGGGTPANFLVGLLERVGLWQSYMDLSDAAVMAMFGPGDTLADLGGDGILSDGTAPAMFFRGPAADFPACRAGDYALDFTVLGTLTDGPSNKGYWHTVGRHLYGPDGRQGRLVGFRYGYDGDAVTTQDFVDYRDTDGVNFNCIAYELWWAMDEDTNPGEPTPSAPGVYNTRALVRAKAKMRAAVRAGLWLVPSLRVSWGTASALASNLAADGGDWQGWADHAKLINDETIAAPGTGKYKARFFAWMQWIMAELLADPEISGAIAYWELWHFPWHNQGGSQTNTLLDLYSDTFAPDMLAAARAVEPNRCLGVSYRHQNALSRAYGQAVNIADPNLIYVTGGYGAHDLLMESPGATSKAWPPSGTDDGPKYTSGQFEFVSWSAAQNIAFHSQEGPGLHTSKQVEPLNASVKTFLEGLGTLYNTYAHGMCWHAWSNRPTAAAGTELGDIIRSDTYFGGSTLYHEERRPTHATAHGKTVEVAFREGAHNAYFNWLELKAAIAECHRLSAKCLVLPAGDYYVDGSFKLAGTHTGLDSDNGSGLLVENWVIHGNGCNLIIPSSPTLANFEDQHSPVLDGSDYANCSDFFVHDGEPWQWGPGINKSTKVGQASFSASGSDFTYATGATVLGMAVENGGVMSRLLQVSRLDYDGETVTPTGTTAVGATSGATARVVRIVDNGTTGELWLTSVKGTFQNNETVNLFTVAGAAAGTVVANGTLDTQPTGLADGEWALNSGGVRVGTRTTGDTFWLTTNDAGNIIDQGGRLRDYKVFLDLCGTARVHFVGKLILTCRTDQDIIAIGTSRQGPKDSNGIKTGGRANIYDDIVIVDAPIGLSTNPIGGVVWDASSSNNEDGQFPSFSMAIFHKLTMSGVIRPFAINSDRGDSFRIGQMETTAIRARSHFENVNASIDVWRGTFNCESDGSTKGQPGHDEPVLEIDSADITIGQMYFHSAGATPATAGAYGLLAIANSNVTVGDLKHDNTVGRTNRPYLVTVDNTLNGFSRSKANRIRIAMDSNTSLGVVSGWLSAVMLLVTHSYTGSTRDSRQITVDMPMTDAADVPAVAVSGGNTTADLVTINQRDSSGIYRVVSGALVKSIDLWARNNLVATTDWSVTDDSDAGYAVGSRWINTSTGAEFVCVDSTSGAAVWKQTAGPDQTLTGDTTTDRLSSTVTTVSSPGATYALDLSAAKQEIAFVADQACTITISNIPSLPITYILRASVAAGGPFNLTFAGTNVSTYPSGDQPAAPASGEAVITIECNGTAAVASQRIATSDVYDLDTQLAAKASTSSLSSHTSNTSNPHSVTLAQVGGIAATDIATGTITPRADDLDLSGGSTGDVLTVQSDGSAAFEAPSGAGISLSPPTAPSNMYYFPSNRGRETFFGGVALSANTEYWYPCYFPWSDISSLFSAVAVKCQTAVTSAELVVSCYVCNSDLTVGTQIFRTSNLDFNTASNIVREWSFSGVGSTSPGWHWLGVASGHAATPIAVWLVETLIPHSFNNGNFFAVKRSVANLAAAFPSSPPTLDFSNVSWETAAIGFR